MFSFLQSSSPKSVIIRIIAAAFAETGAFDKAKAMQEKAIEILQTKKVSSVWMKKDKNRKFITYSEQLKAYKAGKEWRFRLRQH
jgi:hypothetical protein